MKRKSIPGNHIKKEITIIQSHKTNPVVPTSGESVKLNGFTNKTLSNDNVKDDLQAAIDFYLGKIKDLLTKKADADLKVRSKKKLINLVPLTSESVDLNDIGTKIDTTENGISVSEKTLSNTKKAVKYLEQFENASKNKYNVKMTTSVSKEIDTVKDSKKVTEFLESYVENLEQSMKNPINTKFDFKELKDSSKHFNGNTSNLHRQLGGNKVDIKSRTRDMALTQKFRKLVPLEVNSNDITKNPYNGKKDSVIEDTSKTKFKSWVHYGNGAPKKDIVITSKYTAENHEIADDFNIDNDLNFDKEFDYPSDFLDEMDFAEKPVVFDDGAVTVFKAPKPKYYDNTTNPNPPKFTNHKVRGFTTRKFVQLNHGLDSDSREDNSKNTSFWNNKTMSKHYRFKKTTKDLSNRLQNNEDGGKTINTHHKFKNHKRKPLLRRKKKLHKRKQLQHKLKNSSTNLLHLTSDEKRSRMASNYHNLATKNKRLKSRRAKKKHRLTKSTKLKGSRKRSKLNRKKAAVTFIRDDKNYVNSKNYSGNRRISDMALGTISSHGRIGLKNHNIMKMETNDLINQREDITPLSDQDDTYGYPKNPDYQILDEDLDSTYPLMKRITDENSIHMPNIFSKKHIKASGQQIGVMESSPIKFSNLVQIPKYNSEHFKNDRNKKPNENENIINAVNKYVQDSELLRTKNDTKSLKNIINSLRTYVKKLEKGSRIAKQINRDVMEKKNSDGSEEPNRDDEKNTKDLIAIVDNLTLYAEKLEQDNYQKLEIKKGNDMLSYIRRYIEGLKGRDEKVEKDGKTHAFDVDLKTGKNITKLRDFKREREKVDDVFKEKTRINHNKRIPEHFKVKTDKIYHPQRADRKIETTQKTSSNISKEDLKEIVKDFGIIQSPNPTLKSEIDVIRRANLEFSKQRENNTSGKIRRSETAYIPETETANPNDMFEYFDIPLEKMMPQVNTNDTNLNVNRAESNSKSIFETKRNSLVMLKKPSKVFNSRKFMSNPEELGDRSSYMMSDEALRHHRINRNELNIYED